MPETEPRQGRLIIAGSGIRTIAQLTLESAAWIEAADLVCYALADPFTQRWVAEHAKGTEDLAMLYNESTARLATYANMAARLVAHARAGKTVVGLFYGHPGVFTSPSHWAIQMARAEGIEAKMLPAVSAEDCLFADLGVDPSDGACMSVEATEMLLTRRPPQTDSHLIVWQIGVLAQSGCSPLGRSGDVQLLVDYLLKYYPPEHTVTHYRAAQTVVSRTEMQTVSLADLGTLNLNVTSTLYVPPLAPPEFDLDAARELGLDSPDAVGAGTRPRSPDEVWALVDDEHSEVRPLQPPAWYRTRATVDSRIYSLVAALSRDPDFLSRFQQDPVSYLMAGGLDTVETWAVLAGDEAWLAECVRSGDGGAAAVSLGAADDPGQISEFAITPDGRLVKRRRST